MNVSESGWEEVEHTADWAIRVWAPTFEALLVEAANGMYALAGIAPGEGPPGLVEAEGIDCEARLVGLLQELLFELEAHHAAYRDLDVQVSGELVRVRGRRSEVGAPTKTIKAVTYHGLELVETDGRLEATIVFDV